MPSKNYNGNNPLGRKRIKSNGLDTNGALARVETEIGRLQPALSLQTGSLQLPNGRVQIPKRARRGGGGGTSTRCIPWKPRIVDERAEGAINPNYKLYLNPGTVNGMLSATWNEPIDLPTPPEENIPAKFIVLNLTFTQGQINTITYTLESSIPSAADLDPIGSNALPDTLKIIVGTLVGLQSCMVYDTNLLVVSVDVFHERITGVTLGEQPFYIWYKYQVNTAG